MEEGLSYTNEDFVLYSLEYLTGGIVKDKTAFDKSLNELVEKHFERQEDLI